MTRVATGLFSLLFAASAFGISIENTGPVQSGLTIPGNTDNPCLTVDSTTLVADCNSGRIGIGLTSPVTALDVLGSVLLKSTSTTGAHRVLFITDNSDGPLISAQQQGRVGVNYTIPNTRLHVGTDVDSTDTGVTRVAVFTQNDAANPFGVDIRLVGASAAANRRAEFQTGEIDSADGGNIILQRAGGRVGIGIAIPSTLLDVQGAAQFGDGATKSTFSATIGYLGLVPAAQTIAAGNTVAADACGGLKFITSGGAVTTDTTNTFTAPAAANQGCVLNVCNNGASNITLDANAAFTSAGAADVVLTPADCVQVGSSGSIWFQISPIVAN